MSMEKERTRLSNGSGKNLPPPPGFASLTSFRMKRVRITDETESSKEDPTKTDNAVSERCLGHRPWILFDPVNLELDKSESVLTEKDFPPETCLPKGVIRGCSDCSNCLKVKARWRPEDARKDLIQDAPVYYPTEEEYKDPIKYISVIRKSAERYGICRIVPPPSWNPPGVKHDKKLWKSSRFVTHVQRIDGIRVLYSNSETDNSVECGDAKRRRTRERGFDFGRAHGLGESYGRSFDDLPRGPEFTVEAFEKYADDFKGQYFCKSVIPNPDYSSTVSREKWEPSIENIEGEYKRIVDDPTEEIEVLCGDGLETRILGSGFPTISESGDLGIVNSRWNLNNVPKLPGSLLSSNCLASRVLAPRVHLGMCFTTRHWRTEEHHLYALCYLHLGAHKIWYGIPPRGSSNFQVELKNSFADSFDHQHRPVKHLSPSALRSKGIPVYRCVQKPREFVLVFPGVYHSGFDCGFNFSETANFAPLDWLPHGQIAVELYRDLGIKTSLSHDKLLLQAASKAVEALWECYFCDKYTPSNQFWKDACGEEGILTKALKFRVKCEETERKFLCSSSAEEETTEDRFDAETKRECKICLCDLHFSAAGCPCSPNVYSCLSHADHLCDCCHRTARFFLFRHDIGDLNLLVEALGGNLYSVFKYAKEKLGLTLSTTTTTTTTTSSPAPASAPPERKPRSGPAVDPSLRAEIRARLQSLVLKKTPAKDQASGEPQAAPRLFEESPSASRAGEVVPKVNGCRSLLQMELALGSWSDSSGESTSEDESDVGSKLIIKLKSSS